MEVMKVIEVIKRITPEEDRRRLFATELAKAIGPSIIGSGDIVVTKETFRRG